MKQQGFVESFGGILKAGWTFFFGPSDEDQKKKLEYEASLREWKCKIECLKPEENKDKELEVTIRAKQNSTV